MNAFDPRIVRVGLQIEDDVIFFEGLDIRIQGQKYGSDINNSCTVKISNLTKEQRNNILTKATPMKFPLRTPVILTIDVGRESYGTFRLFEGGVYTSSVTPPPDIGVTFVSLTNNFKMGQIKSNSQGAYTQLSAVADSIAKQNDLTLHFEAKDKQIANYAHTGAISKQVEKLQMVGDVRAWVDNKELYVIDSNSYVKKPTLEISMETGMVGVPQASESGVTVQMLIKPGVDLMQRVSLTSKTNPSVNGKDYAISAVGFEIANRDNPFFYTLTLTNQAAYSNGTQ